MTDEEIEKALHCLKGKESPCKDCSYQIREYNCRTFVISDTLDYINRLKEQLYQAEQKLAECENGYQGTLFLERCKHKDELEQMRQNTAKEIMQDFKDILASMDCSMKSWASAITKVNSIGKKFGVSDD